jgi:hypothetical protein
MGWVSFWALVWSHCLLSPKKAQFPQKMFQPLHFLPKRACRRRRLFDVSNSIFFNGSRSPVRFKFVWQPVVDFIDQFRKEKTKFVKLHKLQSKKPKVNKPSKSSYTKLSRKNKVGHNYVVQNKVGQTAVGLTKVRQNVIRQTKVAQNKVGQTKVAQTKVGQTAIGQNASKTFRDRSKTNYKRQRVQLWAD